MHLIVIKAPNTHIAYGPFDDGLAATAWVFPLAPLLDPDEHELTSAAVSPPFDLHDQDLAGSIWPGATPPTPAAGPAAHHAGRAADPRATGFVVHLSQAPTDLSGTVGPFATRSAAQAWWDRQAGFFDQTQADILPIVAPPAVPADPRPPPGRTGP